jgi:hypothetical protein
MPSTDVNLRSPAEFEPHIARLLRRRNILANIVVGTYHALMLSCLAFIAYWVADLMMDLSALPFWPNGFWLALLIFWCGRIFWRFYMQEEDS